MKLLTVLFLMNLDFSLSLELISMVLRRTCDVMCNVECIRNTSYNDKECISVLLSSSMYLMYKHVGSHSKSPKQACTC